jgi:hypothetical protein
MSLVPGKVGQGKKEGRERDGMEKGEFLQTQMDAYDVDVCPRTVAWQHVLSVGETKGGAGGGV